MSVLLQQRVLVCVCVSGGDGNLTNKKITQKILKRETKNDIKNAITASLT